MSTITATEVKKRSLSNLDPWFALASLLLLGMGLIMVTSASMPLADSLMGKPFYYAIHHAIYLGAGLVALVLAFCTPLRFWYHCAPWFLGITILFLIIVIIPGVGREVNGSMRWVQLGPITVQASELAKLAFIFFMARYITQNHKSLKREAAAFIKPMLCLGVCAVLLLLEPDFGATVVMSSTALLMLFLAGANLLPFFMLLGGVAVAFVLLVISAPYRLERLVSFLDPWADPFATGYQLTQALIAFGRGEWFGLGLGNSVQKLLYLPEPHTDFVFSVLAEEFGLVGSVSVLVLYCVWLFRVSLMARIAQARGEIFLAFVSIGIMAWVGLQAFINMGVNSGMLPTKGLTLPFISYGGNSLLLLCAALGILARIDVELKREQPTPLIKL